jgi:hypothetical protein
MIDGFWSVMVTRLGKEGISVHHRPRDFGGLAQHPTNLAEWTMRTVPSSRCCFLLPFCAIRTTRFVREELSFLCGAFPPFDKAPENSV